MSEAFSIGGQAADKRSHLRTLWLMLAGVTIPVLILDQASKLYVASHLRLYQMIALVPNVLDITYTLNPGAAFSLFVNLSPGLRAGMLFAISAAAIVILTILLGQARMITANAVAFALILGGALGNLIDRALRGRVIDFIYMHYYRWSYPVFNLADSAITIGVVLILIASLRGADDAPPGVDA
ncbi:MAG: signal peptidase II [Candidatus Binataceae bacterium]|nr:signal peptidase II [Candidatus Binataceae bacterium]